MPHNSPAWHYVLSHSRGSSTNLIANNTCIIIRTMRQVGIVGVILIVKMTLQNICVTCPRQQHALAHSTFPRQHISWQISEITFGDRTFIWLPVLSILKSLAQLHYKVSRLHTSRQIHTLYLPNTSFQTFSL